MKSPGTREEARIIREFAREHHTDVDSIVFEWVSTFGERFRQIWEEGAHNTEDIKQRLYGVEETGSNYNAMISKLIYAHKTPHHTS